MKTLIFVDYDADTGEAVCRFADGFSELARQQQLEWLILSQRRAQPSP